MIVAIIQARLNSKRFPGKVLYPIGGKSILGHVVDAVRAIKSVDKIIVATHRNGCGPIAGHCESLGVECFIDDGLEVDVLGRFVRCLDAYSIRNSDLVVRVCSDNPLLDSILADELIAEAVESDADYTGYRAGAIPAITVPNGLICEVAKAGALQDADGWLPQNAPHREHVTAALYKAPERYRCSWLPMPDWWDGENRAVDTPSDLDRVAEELADHAH